MNSYQLYVLLARVGAVIAAVVVTMVVCVWLVLL